MKQVATKPNTRVDEIRRDLACPQCGYNLRGLAGAAVDCPECGVLVDVGKLVELGWNAPWHWAPGFERIWRMAFWAFLSAPGILLSLRLLIQNLTGQMRWDLDWRGSCVASVSLIPIVVWLCLLQRMYKATGTPGVKDALLLHLVYVLYLLAVFSPVYIGTSFELPVARVWIFVVPVTVAIGGVFVVRRVERAIAGRCIRRYLIAQSTSN